MLFTLLPLGLAALATGVLTLWLWQGLARWLTDSEFWTQVRELTDRLRTGQLEDFAARYVRMLGALGRYLLRMALRVGATSVPVLAVLAVVPNALTSVSWAWPIDWSAGVYGLCFWGLFLTGTAVAPLVPVRRHA